jgi:AraC-like DNA-binding protein
VHQYALRFAQPHDSDDRLWRLWNRVEPELERKWSLFELSEIAHVSEEHLRRLCRKRYGRSPMQHLTFLRIQRAKNLLSSTDEKIETIARLVGYENPFTFSSLFKKWVGWSPSRYR